VIVEGVALDADLAAERIGVLDARIVWKRLAKPFPRRWSRRNSFASFTCTVTSRVVFAVVRIACGPSRIPTFVFSRCCSAILFAVGGIIMTCHSVATLEYKKAKAEGRSHETCSSTDTRLDVFPALTCFSEFSAAGSFAAS